MIVEFLIGGFFLIVVIVFIWSTIDDKIRINKRKIADLEYRNKELALERNTCREQYSRYKKALSQLLDNVGTIIPDSCNRLVKANGREYSLSINEYQLRMYDAMEDDKAFDKKVQESIKAKSQEEIQTTTGQKEIKE